MPYIVARPLTPARQPDFWGVFQKFAVIVGALAALKTLNGR